MLPNLQYTTIRDTNMARRYAFNTILIHRDKFSWYPNPLLGREENEQKRKPLQKREWKNLVFLCLIWLRKGKEKKAHKRGRKRAEKGTFLASLGEKRCRKLFVKQNLR